MALKLYGYMKCDTCRKAVKWLDAKGVAYGFVDITQNPPTQVELKKALAAGYEIKDLFNKSGVQYRELNMKDKLPGLSQAEAVKLLSGNGYLVKRPIAIQGDRVTVGFDVDMYDKTWGK